MKETLASYRYARALNEYIADDAQAESVLQALRSVAELFSTNDVVEITLKNPAITREVREDVLKSLVDKMELHADAVAFLMLLFERHRLSLLPYIVELFSDLVDERLKRITAEIQTARPLNANDQERIKQSLESYSQKTVALNVQESPELLGGIVAQLGGTVIDGSLRTRLERMKEALLAEEIV